MKWHIIDFFTVEVHGNHEPVQEEQIINFSVNSQITIIYPN